MRDPKLFGDLVGTVRGGALVIGGGPSVPGDLAKLAEMGFTPEVVLSANEHGFRQRVYPITHSVCLDPRHGEKRIPMDALLKELGPHVPIISTCYFGDYRLAEWNLAANTGLSAIAVAIFMGANPVIVTGIDFYRLGNPRAATYFHDRSAASNSLQKTPKNFSDQIKALEQWIGVHPHARALSGPLATRWGALHSLAPLPAKPLADLPHAKRQRSFPTCVIQAHPSRPLTFAVARVPAGYLIAASPTEASSPVISGLAKLIETRPPPGCDSVELPPALMRAARGYRPRTSRDNKAPSSPSPLRDLQAEQERE